MWGGMGWGAACGVGRGWGRVGFRVFYMIVMHYMFLKNIKHKNQQKKNAPYQYPLTRGLRDISKGYPNLALYPPITNIP